MSQRIIRAVLESRLDDWASNREPALRVAYENASFEPATGETYLRARVLPASTTSEDLEGAHRAYRGVFQVSIVSPINDGAGAEAGIADEIGVLFPVNLRLSLSGITIQIITPASAAPALQKESSFIVPVSVTYRSDRILVQAQN